MPGVASTNSCLVCEAHATCLAAACRYEKDPEYKSAMEDLTEKKEALKWEKDNLLELRKKENLLRSQGELLGPCCGALAGCRSRGGPEGCTSIVNSLSARGCWQEHCWAALVNMAREHG